MSTPQITLHSMCGGFQLEGDDWNNTMRLCPSCGVKQKAPWREAADRMEQLRAPLPPPDNHNIFSPSLFLSVFVLFLPHRQARNSEWGHRRGRWCVSTVHSLFSQTDSGGQWSSYRELAGTADTLQQSMTKWKVGSVYLPLTPLPLFADTAAILQVPLQEIDNAQSAEMPEKHSSALPLLPQCCSACCCLHYLGSKSCLLL